VQQEVIAKWAANAPLTFTDQYIGNLRQYRAIAIDVGDQDGLRAGASRPHEILDTYGIANTFVIYPGTHTSAVADRFQNHVMPFFSKHLVLPRIAGEWKAGVADEGHWGVAGKQGVTDAFRRTHAAARGSKAVDGHARRNRRRRSGAGEKRKQKHAGIE
jgi:hypothetical protein